MTTEALYKSILGPLDSYYYMVSVYYGLPSKVQSCHARDARIMLSYEGLNFLAFCLRHVVP
jgi:hypothetical protein